jgi:hypothetical protein
LHTCTSKDELVQHKKSNFLKNISNSKSVGDLLYYRLCLNYIQIHQERSLCHKIQNQTRPYVGKFDHYFLTTTLYHQKNVQSYQCINYYKFCMNVHTKSCHQIVIPPLHECMMKHPPKTHVMIIDRPLHTPCLVSIPPRYTKPHSIASEGVTRSRHMCMFIAYLACVVGVWERTAHIPGHGKPNLNGQKIPGLGMKSRIDCRDGINPCHVGFMP